MGFFGIDSFREPSLTMPDPPEPDDAITEESEHLVRRMFKDGHIEWERKAHDIEGYEQDCYEEAYELGQKSIEQQMQNLRQSVDARVLQAKADGVFAAATTAYERGKR
jgi:predicted secreted Zn-dependent protease